MRYRLPKLMIGDNKHMGRLRKVLCRPVSPHACAPNHHSFLSGLCPHPRGITIQCPRGRAPAPSSDSPPCAGLLVFIYLKFKFLLPKCLLSGLVAISLWRCLHSKEGYRRRRDTVRPMLGFTCIWHMGETSWLNTSVRRSKACWW